MKLKLPTKDDVTPANQFLQACALARMKAITGIECQALTGESQKDILAMINTDECKALAMQIQVDGLASEVSAQIDLFRTQMKLRERMDDPEIGTGTLLAIGQFLFTVGGMKERRQAKVQEATPKMGVFIIQNHHSDLDIAGMREGFSGGIGIDFRSDKKQAVIDNSGEIE